MTAQEAPPSPGQTPAPPQYVPGETEGRNYDDAEVARLTNEARAFEADPSDRKRAALTRNLIAAQAKIDEAINQVQELIRLSNDDGEKAHLQRYAKKLEERLAAMNAAVLPKLSGVTP